MPRKFSYEVTPFNERFHLVIDSIKEKHRLTERKIAEAIGISPPALNALKIGKSKTASKSTLLLMEKNFKVNIEWLLTGVGDCNSILKPLPEKESGLKYSVPENTESRRMFDLYDKLINEKDRLILLLEHNITNLNERIGELKKENQELKSKILHSKREKSAI